MGREGGSRGRGRTAIDLLLLVAIGGPLAVAGGLSWYHGSFAPTIDAVDYGQIARGLLAGHGFSSDVVIPVSTAFPFGRALPQPLMYRPPGYPAALVPFLAAVGSRDAALIAAGIAFLIAAGAATYFLGRQAGGRTLGLAAAAVVLLHAGLWREAGDASAEPLATALVALLFLAALTGRPFLAGLSFAAVALTKTNLAVLLPVVFFPPPLRGARWRGNAVLFAAGALLLLSPWMVRNLRVTGRPFFDLHAYTEGQRAASEHRGFGMEFHRRTEAIPLAGMAAANPGRVLAHAARGLAGAARRLPAYFGPGMLALLALAAAVRPPAGPRRGVQFLPHAALGIVAVALSPLVLTPRYLIPLLPLCAVGGIGALLDWTRDATGARRPLGSPRMLAVAALVGLLAAPPAIRLGVAARAFASGSLGRFWPPATENLRAQTDREDAVLSDDLSIAWYAERKVLWLPWDAAALRALDEAIPIDAVFLRASDDEIQTGLGAPTRDAIAAFVATECEPAGRERDGTGRLFLRRRPR